MYTTYYLLRTCIDTSTFIDAVNVLVLLKVIKINNNE